MEAVRDGDLLELLPVQLTRHLTALDTDERRSVALHIARALGRRYRVRRSASTSPTTPQASRADLDAALAIAGRDGLRQATGDTRLVAEYLGHEDLSTVSRYAHVASEEMHAAV